MKHTPSAGTRDICSSPLDRVDFHWIGGSSCTFATQGESSTFDAASAGFGFSMAPVSRTIPAVKLALGYSPGIPYENTTRSCPGGKPVPWHTHGWSTDFTETHEYERDGTAFRASA